MINKICRCYRIETGATLRDLAQSDKHIKTLSAFEHGRSSNMAHLETYLNHARQRGELPEFLERLAEGVNNGDK